jgi:hypothetical protein
MSANVEFSIIANDQASDVFSEVSSNASQCFSSVESSAGEAAAATESAGSEMQTSMQGVSTAASDSAGAQLSAAQASGQLADNQAFSSTSTLNNVQSVGALATASAGLVTSVCSLESAEVSLDKAHVTVAKDQDALTTAQIAAQKAATDVITCQNALNTAIAKYGSGSSEATAAQQKLNEAQETAQNDTNKVTVAQEALQIAQQRVGVAQNSVNESIMMSAVMIIPSVITMFTSLNTLIGTYPAIATAASAATDALGTAMDFLAANPIVLIIAGIALLAVGLYEAYEHCAPFREAINEIGTVLGGAFKEALTLVSSTLNFLWNDVFKPFGEFLATVFIDAYLKPLELAWSLLSTGLNALWHGVLEPVADFFKGVFAAAVNFALEPIKLFEDAISKVSGLMKPITGLIGDLTGALKGLCFAHAAPAAEEFNAQVSKSIELSEGLTQGLDPLKQGLLGVAGSTATAGGSAASNQQTQAQQELISETKNLANVMSKLTATAKKSGTLNQGIAQQMARRF